MVFSAEPVRNYRGFLGMDDRYSHAHWLYQHNGGVFLPPWGKIEQWLISVQHDEADIDRLVTNFAAFARAVDQLGDDEVSIVFRCHDRFAGGLAPTLTRVPVIDGLFSQGIADGRRDRPRRKR